MQNKKISSRVRKLKLFPLSLAQALELKLYLLVINLSLELYIFSSHSLGFLGLGTISGSYKFFLGLGNY